MKELKIQKRIREARQSADFSAYSQSCKWKACDILETIVEQARNTNCSEIIFGKSKNHIVITNIPSLYQYGTDYDAEYVAARLRGLAEAMQDISGYLVFVKTTHDLNSAEIPDLKKLVDFLEKM